MPMIDRVPPQNIDAEQAVLGAMLIKKEAIAEVSQILRPEDFYRDAHKIVYEAMLTLFNKNEPADIVTVSDYLNNENLMEKVGGVTFITALANTVPTAANVTYHAKIVREKSDLRHLINTATDIAGVVAAYKKAGCHSLACAKMSKISVISRFHDLQSYNCQIVKLSNRKTAK